MTEIKLTPLTDEEQKYLDGIERSVTRLRAAVNGDDFEFEIDGGSPFDDVKILLADYDRLHAAKSCSQAGCSDTRQDVNGLRDRIAELIWRSEYRRATGKERTIEWAEVADKDVEKYLYVAEAIVQLLAAQPANSGQAKRSVVDLTADELNDLATEAFGEAAAKTAVQRQEGAVVYCGWHNDRGWNFGTMAETQQGASSRLMMTGIAGNHGWEIRALAALPSQSEASGGTSSPARNVTALEIAQSMFDETHEEHWDQGASATREIYLEEAESLLKKYRISALSREEQR